MKQNKFLFALLAFVVSFGACETYPDWDENLEYSDTYPISGEYYVMDYDGVADTLTSSPYILYIYNKAYNPTKDSIWVDNYTGHPTGGLTEYAYKFKIKCKANMSSLTFNVERAGNVQSGQANPLDSAITVSISESILIDYDPGDITSAKPDSIYFKFSYFDKYGVLVRTMVTAGHRKTGWEEPNYDDNM